MTHSSVVVWQLIDIASSSAGFLANAGCMQGAGSNSLDPYRPSEAASLFHLVCGSNSPVNAGSVGPHLMISSSRPFSDILRESSRDLVSLTNASAYLLFDSVAVKGRLAQCHASTVHSLAEDC